ncbi:DUF1236 domain-containing protein [Bradyrhizobium sp. 2TAF36]|uniref:DUF1236 domain-containing protein n=1 Tax=Bradyrhizobium sp. 2TAF36 TaxID=3233016 RepID=UPI003F9252B6
MAKARSRNPSAQPTRKLAKSAHLGAMFGGTVGAAVGAGLEIPNAVLGGIPRDDSVVIHERVLVGEPLPPTVVLRPMTNYTEYRDAVVNDRRVIVEPRTRRVVKIID